MRHRLLAPCVCAAFSLLASPALTDPLDSATFKTCMNDAAGVTFAMNACLTQEISRQDKILDAAYQTLKRRLAAAPRRIELRAAERGWLRRTQAKCSRAGDDSAGGAIAPTEIESCYLSEIELRTAHLRSLAIEHR